MTPEGQGERIRDDVIEVVPTETTGPFLCVGAHIGCCRSATQPSALQRSFYGGAVALITSSQSEARGVSP